MSSSRSFVRAKYYLLGVETTSMHPGQMELAAADVYLEGWVWVHWAEGWLS